MIDVPNASPDAVLSFVRADERNKVFAVFNFSASALHVGFKENLFAGNYTEFTTGRPTRLDENSTLDLPAWGYKVFVR